MSFKGAYIRLFFFLLLKRITHFPYEKSEVSDRTPPSAASGLRCQCPICGTLNMKD